MTDDERSRVVLTIAEVTGKTPHVRWSHASGDWVAEEGIADGDRWARADDIDTALLGLLRAVVIP